ncbi:Uncharacterized protein DBV15_07838 [Temnothorax longispinosus]|uniref:C2H2-type domain-containing protein n=1 Tax=Temnothorax longispinosus TaxID=300112 RepID=A0A4S2JZK3_9HYME|nr:Uncharacterized protein DBV15_07838 [Temnothorax longispinosus]
MQTTRLVSRRSSTDVFIPDGGVLVVNVTWRGKTYVGTLLDCTRHDWAPPRFCDSPTSDLDARTPKGRGKRGRAAANSTPGNDLSNFTETRSSVHSKLRNGGKGRRGAQGSPAASPSPAAFVPPRPDPAAKRKSRGPEEEQDKNKRRAPPPTPPSGSPPASPVLLECPEPNCSKKYKHINGLKYHQSHAHGSADDDDTKEGITSMSENDESNIEAPSPATPVKSPADKPEGTPVRAQQQQASLQSIASQHAGLQNLASQVSQQAAGLQAAPPPSSHPGQGVQSHLQQYPTAVSLHAAAAKMPQFKVKPTAALMPEQDKSKTSVDARVSKPQGYKKKSRKSPGGSPHPSPLEAPIVDSARDDVQSPAYSDISDDAAPVLEAEPVDKSKQSQEKDNKATAPAHLPAHFSMYPYYGQSPYLVSNVSDSKPVVDQKPSDLTPKQEMKPLNIPQMPSMASLQSVVSEKEKKELSQPVPQPQQQPHYYGGYGGYMPPGYAYQPPQPVSQQQQQQQSQQSQDQEPHEQKAKIKQEPQPQPSLKDKQHENHQILKESIEMKSQMSPYHVYHSSQSQRAAPPPPPPGPVQDDRRYYLYPSEQRRKEEANKQSQQAKAPPPSPKHQPKQEKPQDLGKSEDSKSKQEGVKPTMETQGPPPPPTSQYAYIHPSYMQPQHYGALPFDPGHPVYRGLSPMLVPGPYSSNPYLHQLPRYHAPEDLSRPPGGKALDLLQHHANQYYSAHKIHELQERALKSPTPKTSAASASPSSAGPTPARPPSGPPTSVAGPGPPPGQGQQPSGKQQGQPGSQQQQQGAVDASGGNLGKDNRSPPPQRHVHTHHHTHVGLGYPLLTGQYPAPYGGKPLVRP